MDTLGSLMTNTPEGTEMRTVVRLFDREDIDRYVARVRTVQGRISRKYSSLSFRVSRQSEQCD